MCVRLYTYVCVCVGMYSCVCYLKEGVVYFRFIIFHYKFEQNIFVEFLYFNLYIIILN